MHVERLLEQTQPAIDIPVRTPDAATAAESGDKLLTFGIAALGGRSRPIAAQSEHGIGG